MTNFNYTAKLTDQWGVTLVDFTTGPIRLGGNAKQRTANTYPYDQTFEIYSTNGSGLVTRMTQVQKIMRIFGEAEESISAPHAPEYVWFELHEEGEFPKRAIVYGGDIGLNRSPLQRGSGAVDGTMIITRGPWESTTPVQLNDSSLHSLLIQGGAIKLPPLGDMPGRIARLDLGELSVAGTASNFFCGIRPFFRGIDDFDPFIDINTTSAALTLNLETLVESVVLSDAFPGADYRHWQGRYRLFLRGTLATDLAQIRIKVTNDTAPGGIIPGIWTDSRFVENGLFNIYFEAIDIPLAGGKAYHKPEVLGGTEFEFYVTNLSGTGTITITHLVLVPDERVMQSDTAFFQSTGGSRQYIDVSPHDELYSYSYDPTNKVMDQQGSFVSVQNWTYPPEGGVFVLCAEYDHDTLTVDTFFTIYPRWHLYRTRDR